MTEYGADMQVMDYITENGLKNAAKVSRQIWVPYPPELCFTKIASQLEVPANWDPCIMHVWPLSDTRNEKGSLSRILINLGGQIHNCRAMIYKYQPYSCFSWFLTDHPRIWVNWRTMPQNSGTYIGITIAREQTAPLFDKLWWKVRYQIRLAMYLEKMLNQLKSDIENNS